MRRTRQSSGIGSVFFLRMGIKPRKRGQIWRVPYLVDGLLKCCEREWGYCSMFWKARGAGANADEPHLADGWFG